VISKSLGVLALALLVFSNRTALIMVGAAVVFILLVWALVRVIMQTLRARGFVTSQQKLLAIAAKAIDQPLKLDVAPQPAYARPGLTSPRGLSRTRVPKLGRERGVQQSHYSSGRRSHWRPMSNS
jgi:hypothetical protein